MRIDQTTFGRGGFTRIFLQAMRNHLEATGRYYQWLDDGWDTVVFHHSMTDF